MLEFIERFGAALTFVIIFLDQLGLPIPATPIVIALGALVEGGSIEPISSLAAGTAASLGADLLWFRLGRLKGARVLSFVCRISLEPDTCVSKTKGIFSRYGVKSLLVAKFVPGFERVAPPLAGLLGVGALRFVLWSGAGALVWLATLGGLGYAFSSRVEDLPGQLERLGSTFGLIVLGLLAAYVGWKYLGRRRVLRDLQMARITPEELHSMILAGEGPAIVDVRNDPSLESIPFTIPGALCITLAELDQRHHEIPRESDVILYCS